MKTLYVGNLPFSSTDAEIRELFGLYGEVRNVNIVLDRLTGKPRGFAFVSLDDEPADKALAALNGQLFAGRRLQISEARPPAERSGTAADRRDRNAGDRPFRPRPGFHDDRNAGDRPPFRPRPGFHDDRNTGDRPFRPRPGFHDDRAPGDRPSFRPRPDFHESKPAGDDYFNEEDDMGGEESSTPPPFEERRQRPHRSFNNKKSYHNRRDRDSEDGFRRPRRPPFRGGRHQDRDKGFSPDDDED